MKATKDYISLDTAKLLKACGVKTEHYFEEYYGLEGEIKYRSVYGIDREYTNYPAYTWQKILWEHAEEFFEKIENYLVQNPWNIQDSTRKILELLQQKKYEEADLYFRKNSILIKK